MSIGYLLQVLKIAACAAFVGLAVAHTFSSLTSATIAVGLAFVLLGMFA